MEKTNCAGVVDIGTNSIKLLIAEEYGDVIKVLESMKNIVPLDNDTFYKERISQETINRTVEILNRYREKFKEYSVSRIRVIATTAVREALNKDVFIDTVHRKTGFNISVLTDGDVTYYIDGYLYHKMKEMYPVHTKNLIIAELGAGSLDVSVTEKGLILINKGLPLGTLRIKQLGGKLDGSLKENYEAIEENVDNEFACLQREMPPIDIDDIILIDETYSSHLFKICSDKKAGESFFKLGETQAKEILEKVTDRNIEEIASRYKIPPETAEIFPGYAIILNSFVKLSRNKSIHIFEAPLAQAVLADMIKNFEITREYNKTNQLISIADTICRKFNADMNHARHVAYLSGILFDNLKEILGLRTEEALYLIMASYLHDIGMFVYARSHHKHGEYIVSCLNLFRLTAEEVKVVACIGRYHRKGVPSENHPLYNSLSVDRQVLVQKLSSILKITNSLDRSHKQKVKKIDVELSDRHAIKLNVVVKENFLLEKTDFLEKKLPFEEISGNKINLRIKYTEQ